MKSTTKCFTVLLAWLALTATAPAEEIKSRWLALRWNGQSGELRSTADAKVTASDLRLAWPVATVQMSDVDDAKFGSGRSLTLRHDNGWTTTLSLFDASPFLHCSTVIHHGGDRAFIANKLPSISWNAELNIPTENVRVIGTGGLSTVEKAKGSYAFSMMADPDSRRGIVAGWLTHHRGIGLFFPETSNSMTPKVRSEIEFGRLQVDSGGSRPTETLLIGVFNDCRVGIESYADDVALNESIKLKPKPNVYCTWYHAGASTEEKLTKNTRFAATHLRPFGLSVMQIDDLWQTQLPKDSSFDVAPDDIEKHGPYKVFTDANQNYPRGMSVMAQEIHRQNMTPGIWFMPFAGNHHNPYFDHAIFAKRADGTPYDDNVANWSGTCIDISNPIGEAFVRRRVRRVYDWGYRYFKIDGAHTGIPSPNIYVNTSYKDDRFGEAQLHDPSVTHAEAYRRGLTAIHEEAPMALVLGCNVSQNMRSMGPAFGLLDAMRIGPDNGAAGRGRWDQVTRGAWHGSNLYFLNNRVWYNDPDPVFVRSSNPISSARWMCTWMAIAGALHTTSEQYSELSNERLDLIKRCLPSHRIDARPVDYLETNRPRIWRASNDRVHVIGLFNWDEQNADTVTYPLDRMGLSAEADYVGFDFWANRYVMGIQGDLKVTLPEGTCMSLALRQAATHPQIISTSRHVTQGLMDITAETWDADKRVLRGTSKVVAGDSYEMRLVLAENSGLKVTQATLAGERCLMRREPGDPPNTIRVVAEPQATGLANWTIQTNEGPIAKR